MTRSAIEPLTSKLHQHTQSNEVDYTTFFIKFQRQAYIEKSFNEECSRLVGKC